LMKASIDEITILVNTDSEKIIKIRA